MNIKILSGLFIFSLSGMAATQYPSLSDYFWPQARVVDDVYELINAPKVGLGDVFIAKGAGMKFASTDLESVYLWHPELKSRRISVEEPRSVVMMDGEYTLYNIKLGFKDFEKKQYVFLGKDLMRVGSFPEVGFIRESNEELNLVSFYGGAATEAWMVVHFAHSPLTAEAPLTQMPSTYVIPDEWRYDVANTLAFFSTQPNEKATREYLKEAFTASIKERPFAKLIAWAHALRATPDATWLTIPAGDLSVDRYYTACLTYLVFRVGQDAHQAIFSNQVSNLLAEPASSVDREGMLLGAALAYAKYDFPGGGYAKQKSITSAQPVPAALKEFVAQISQSAKSEKPVGPYVIALIDTFITKQTKVPDRTDRALK